LFQVLEVGHDDAVGVRATNRMVVGGTDSGVEPDDQLSRRMTNALAAEESAGVRDVGRFNRPRAVSRIGLGNFIIGPERV
jgi:hypothetical protein